MLKQLVSHHVCGTSQKFHLLPRQKAGIKAGAVASTSVKDVVCNPLGEKGLLALLFMKKYLFCIILAIFKSKIFVVTVENIETDFLIHFNILY